MNGKQYNNIINNTIKNNTKSDRLEIARDVLNNMGVALPQGDLSTISEILQSDDYMYWKSYTAEEAQVFANDGIAAIGITDTDIMLLAADEPLEAIDETISNQANITKFASNPAAVTNGTKYYAYGTFVNNSEQVNVSPAAYARTSGNTNTNEPSGNTSSGNTTSGGNNSNNQPENDKPSGSTSSGGTTASGGTTSGEDDNEPDTDEPSGNTTQGGTTSSEDYSEPDIDEPSGNTSSGGSTLDDTYHNTTSGDTIYVLNYSSVKSVDLGWTGTFEVHGGPFGNIASGIQWYSSNERVATVNTQSGSVVAQNPGVAVIYAYSNDNRKINLHCELWVRGKKPVILIHGRISNSLPTWGAINSIFSNPLDEDDNDNDHYAARLEAYSIGDPAAQYIRKETQDICNYKEHIDVTIDETKYSNYIVPGIFNGKFDGDDYISPHPEGGNLAYYLQSLGYNENINLFAFNYPNTDAVIYSAKKLEAYINNLIEHVRHYGSDEMKACFYDSRIAFENNSFKINLIGHSMGGLVSRYYIENLGYDNYVDRLVTIDTPHWGSGFASLSSFVGVMHKICDHDLKPQSSMYGGDISRDLCPCDPLLLPCTLLPYVLTDELQYNKSRSTKYYAIAGIDHEVDDVEENDFWFSVPTNLTTYNELKNHLASKHTEFASIDIKDDGDGVVSFISQIGWNEPLLKDCPSKIVPMEKIVVCVDTDGGNTVSKHLHTKMPHRKAIMPIIYDFLNT